MAFIFAYWRRKLYWEWYHTPFMDINTARNVLGLNGSESPHDVKKAYHRAAVKCHPDRGGDEEEFKRIQEAYETLLNPPDEDVMFTRLADMFVVRSTIPVTVQDILNHVPQTVTIPGEGSTTNITFTTPDERFLVPMEFGTLEIMPHVTSSDNLKFVPPNNLEMTINVPLPDLIFGTTVHVRVPGKRVRAFDMAIKPITCIKDKMCFRFAGGGMLSTKGTGDLIIRVKPTFPFNPQAATQHREAIIEVFS